MKWESFLPLELLGFAMLVFGTLVYNEIVIMPIGFLNYWTKREISKRKQDEEGLLDAQADDSNNTNYIATSPTGATSGGQRN